MRACVGCIEKIEKVQSCDSEKSGERHETECLAMNGSGMTLPSRKSCCIDE